MRDLSEIRGDMHVDEMEDILRSYKRELNDMLDNINDLHARYKKMRRMVDMLRKIREARIDLEEGDERSVSNPAQSER